jgi:HTH-type transcriptional repressor of NAD biosynthesis genes
MEAQHDLRRRLCLIGPESTGKSQVAARLARELRVPWVREYAREYAEERGGTLSAADVEPIGRGAMALLDAVDASFAVLDTDLIATVVYARHYYGDCPRWIVDEAWRRRADVYLLFDTDIEWHPDPARDAGGDAREDLFDAFRAALDEFDTRWDIVSGVWEERYRKVSAMARSIIATGAA